MRKRFNEGVDVNDFENFRDGLDEDVYTIIVMEWYKEDLFYCDKPKRPTTTKHDCILSIDQLRDFEHAGWHILDPNNALKDFEKVYEDTMQKEIRENRWYSENKFSQPHPIKEVNESIAIAVKTINEREICDKLRDYGYNEKYIDVAKRIIEDAEDYLDYYNDSEILLDRDFTDAYRNIDPVFVRDTIDLIMDAYNKQMDENMVKPQYKSSNSYLPYPITEKMSKRAKKIATVAAGVALGGAISKAIGNHMGKHRQKLLNHIRKNRNK